VLGSWKYYAGWADKIPGGISENSGGDYHTYQTKEPVGVCGQIIPWNFPMVSTLAPHLQCCRIVFHQPLMCGFVGSCE
jgi:acyl-CoA reductase-like NAD-dependent aldehyde dehydrogenase